ncbi:MAG: ribonuclease P protein component [Candidatus Magasanikbacteria bacterium]|nr:ribonuclease P protein component [Candidatus Magasanikbacteria bacterium]
MKDFEILFKEGRFFGGRLLDLKIWKIDPNKYPRRSYKPEDLKIGFVVGKKVHKSAVKRNLIRRRMREVLRLLLKEGLLEKGFMFALIAKPLILAKKYQEIEQDIVHLLKIAHILNIRSDE